MPKINVVLMLSILLSSCLSNPEFSIESEEWLNANKMNHVQSITGNLACGTPDSFNKMPLSPEQMNRLLRNTYGDTPSSIQAPPCGQLYRKNLYIKFHVVRNVDGGGGIPPRELNDIIRNMNEAFDQVLITPNYSEEWYFLQSKHLLSKISFVNSEVNYIDDSRYYETSVSEFSALTNIDRDPNKLNIYMVNRLITESGDQLGGIAYIGGNVQVISRLNNSHLGTTPAHEVGHNLSLKHTHQSSNSLCLDENFSHTTGDAIWDTPIDLSLYGLINSACDYTGNQKTECGEDLPYSNIESNTENMMSYARQECRSGFSLGQYYQMNAQIRELGLSHSTTYLNPCGPSI